MIFTMMMILVNILIMILIMMILAIVMRPRAQLTPHVPVNYPNSLQVSTHGARTALKSNAAHWRSPLSTALLSQFSQLRFNALQALSKVDLCCQRGFTVSHELHCAAPRVTTLHWILQDYNAFSIEAVQCAPTQCKKAGDKSSFCLWSPGSSDPGVERCMLEVSNTLPITLFFNAPQ